MVRPSRLPVVAALGLAAVTAAGIGACADDEATTSGAGGTFRTVDPGVLTVATNFPAAGFWEGDSVDRPTGGFEYELARHLAEALELDGVRVVDTPFEDIVSGGGEGYDIALAQVSVTPDREEAVDFSAPYLTTPVGVVGAAGAGVEAGDLAEARDLRWGAVEATTEVGVVDDLVEPRTGPARVYGSTEDALAGVRAGEVDVVALDYARALGEISAAGDLSLVAQVTAPQHYGVVLPQGSGNREAVDSALRRLEADGTLAELTDELFSGFEDGVDRDVPTIRVAG